MCNSNSERFEATFGAPPSHSHPLPPTRALFDVHIYVNCKRSYDTPTSTAVTTHFSSPKSYRPSTLPCFLLSILFFVCSPGRPIHVRVCQGQSQLQDSGVGRQRSTGRQGAEAVVVIDVRIKNIGRRGHVMLCYCCLIVFGWRYPQCC